MVVGDWPNSGKSSGSGERLMRAKVREKINKIRIYIVIVTMHICIITIANLYIYTIIEGLMQSKFKKYCVNFASFSILYIFTPTDVNALMATGTCHYVLLSQ